jgi:hypothetical protein
MVVLLCEWGPPDVHAGDLTVTLGGPGTDKITLVGAIRRWDDDGKPRVPVDPKAKIDAPRVDAQGVGDGNGNGRWSFRGLAPGRYDLVVIQSNKVRLEGFHYPPVKEFDPFWASDAKAPEDETCALVVDDIAKSRHYENKVTPLFLAANDPGTEVRVFVQLVRDLPTSYDRDFGAPVATARHEVWQYTNRYGGWVKERATRVFDRVLMARTDFEQWTWVWEPRLGGIIVGEAPATVMFPLPDRLDPRSARGWFPR